MNKILLLCSVSLLVTACSVNSNPNPNNAGLFGSMYHLSKGTYEKRHKNRQAQLKQISQEQVSNKKKLHILNQQLLQKRQESEITENSLALLKKKLQQKNQQLQESKKRYASSKKQHSALESQIKRLDADLKTENIKAIQQASYISELKKERNALRKEIIMQTSTSY